MISRDIQMKCRMICAIVFILVAGILVFVGSTFYKKDLDECEKCRITFEGV